METVLLRIPEVMARLAVGSLSAAFTAAGRATLVVSSAFIDLILSERGR